MTKSSKFIRQISVQYLLEHSSSWSISFDDQTSKHFHYFRKLEIDVVKGRRKVLIGTTRNEQFINMKNVPTAEKEIEEDNNDNSI